MITLPHTRTSPQRRTGRNWPLADRQIEAFAELCETCARPPRWRGSSHNGGPTTCAFFLISAASVAWVEAAAADPRIRLVDVSIEAMATFAAIEASIATGRPQLVICGAGPGTLGHLWAIPAARAQGATVLLLVPRTPPDLAGAVDIQESSAYAPLHMAGASLFDEVITMDAASQMPRIVQRLRHLFSRPEGAVVQLNVPTNLLMHECPPLRDHGRVDIALPAPSAATIARVTELLRGPGGPPAFLFGSGAVTFRDRLATLVERWGAVHFSTPAAAGIVPGSLGSIGNAAGGDVPRRLRELEVPCVVILGSRLGTASGGGNDELLPPNCHVVHVDVAADIAAGNAVATQGHPTTFIQSDIGTFLDAMSHDARGVT